MLIKDVLKYVISIMEYIWRSYVKNGLQVKNVDFTLDFLVNSNASFVRFGDGEVAIIKGHDIRFQTYSEELKNELIKTLENKDKGYAVAVPDIYTFSALKQYRKEERKAWQLESVFSYPIYSKYCKNQEIYSSLVSRLYLPFECSKNKTRERFLKIKKIWEDKSVLIVEGRYTRLGVGNDLFDNVCLIKRILCPEKNAYDLVDMIVEEIKKQQTIDKPDLVILSLGPTSKVIMNRMHGSVRMLDLGHLDIEYEWYLKNATTKTAISGKAVNEAVDGYDELLLSDDKYEKEIVARIY